MWVQTICEGYQVTTKVAPSKKRNIILILHFVALLLNAVKREIEKMAYGCSTKIALTVFSYELAKDFLSDLFHLGLHRVKLS